MSLKALLLLMVKAKSILQGDPVCYPPYGCFNDEAPFDKTLILLPQPPHLIDTKFLLYTRTQKANAHILTDVSSIRASTFDANKKTTFIMHGFTERGSIFYMRKMIDELLKVDDMNIVVVDWEKGAKKPYSQAAGNLRLVGAQISHLIEMMNKDLGLSFKKVHLIGFSLGAQGSGYAGRNLRRKGHTIGRITGLDPAGILFQNTHVDVRLDPSDADFVDVIHTDSKSLLVAGIGTGQSSGHIDFFPNGGFEQPNCRRLDQGIFKFFTCSHYRAVHYFTESISGRCQFIAYPCKSYKDFKKATCTTCPANGCPIMGYHADEHKGKVSGDFYLRTRGEKPFCVYHYKVTLYTGSHFFAGLLFGPVKIVITGNKAISETLVLRRILHPNSVEEFLVMSKYDLGNPAKIKVWQEGFLERWLLKKVVVQKFNARNEYVGCFNKWLNSPHNQVSMKKTRYC